MTSHARFTLFRRDNPCPLCESTDGRCKTAANELILCMSLTDNLGIPGYRFLGRTRDQTWGLWKEDDPYTRHDRPRPDVTRSLTRSQKRPLFEVMPVTERDTYYRQMLAQLTLHPDDRADLNRRGFTDQRIAELGWFVSFRHHQPIGTFPKHLPGVLSRGNATTLATHYEGHLCAVPDAYGRIQGFQCHNRTGPKYTWLSTRNHPVHLPSGQLPVGVYWPQQLQVTDTIGIAEGYAIKPQLAADLLGMVVLSADNANMAGRRDEFQQQLAQVQTLLPTEAISLLILPDAGDVQNPQVRQRNRNNEKLYNRLGLTYHYAWWGQIDKTHPDIDELDPNQTIQPLSRDEFWAMADQISPPWWYRVQTLLQHRHRQHRHRIAKPLNRQPLATDSPDSPLTIYERGERLTHWVKRIQAGDQVILDVSETGTGKSYTAGQLTPKQCGVSQILYVSSQHRNPTVETLTATNEWIDLEARHAGLRRESTPNGQSRLKRADAGQPHVVPPNCSRNLSLSALREQGVVGSDSANLICQACHLLEKCRHSGGHGFGFLQQRRLALSSSKVRLHPDSLPDPTTFDYRDVVIVWEEMSEVFKPYRTLNIDVSDVKKIVALLGLDYLPLLTTLQPLLNALAHLLEQPNGRYGIGHQQILAELPPVPEVDREQLRAILAPDLSLLNPTAAYGVDIADLPAPLRHCFSDRDATTAQKIADGVVKQWLPDLLTVLQGGKGSVHIQQGVLTLTVPHDRLRQIFWAARSNIALDTTLSPADLAQLLGCQPDAISTCKQIPQPTPNLSIIQIDDLGRMGMQRGREQQRRANAVVDALCQQDPTTKVIDFKKFAQSHRFKGGQGIWWGDSRGSNDFIGTNTLVLIGTPCPNLASLQAEWRILTETEPTGPDFEAWVNRKIEAHIIQGIGRVRAHLRPEPITVYLLSNFPLTLPTSRKRASEITPDAADKKEAKIEAMRRVCLELHEAGIKATRPLVAELTGIARGTVNRLWLSVISLLLETSIAERSGPEPTEESQVVEAVEAIEQLADAPPSELLPRLERWWHTQIPPDWLPWVWDRLQYATQMAIWRALIGALTPQERRQLLLAVTS